MMTNFRDSVISRYADHLICTSQEQHKYGDAIFSRTSQILVVDMLYLAIIATDYDRYLERLRRSEYIIRTKLIKAGTACRKSVDFLQVFFYFSLPVLYKKWIEFDSFSPSPLVIMATFKESGR